MPGFSPIGAAPLGALGDRVLNEDVGDAVAGSDVTANARLLSLSQALAAGDLPSPQVWPALADALTAGDALTSEVLANLIERLRGSDGIHTAATLAASASTGVGFFDSVMSAWQLLLAENIAVAGEAAGNIRKLAALIDALAATGQATGNMSAFAACTSAIALEGLLAQGFNANAVEQVLLADTAAAVAKLLGPLVDGVLASDTAAATLRISAIANEALVIDDDPAALLRGNATLSDGVLLYASLRLGGTDYVGWALNTDLKAATEYRQYPFDSFATFKNRHYAAGPNGLVRRGGNTDAGVPIEAWLRTALLDFGTSKFKRVPDVYLGLRTNGAMVLKVITQDTTGAKVEDWYSVERTRANGPGAGNVGVGRGLRSTWWQFELHNVSGSDFALEDLSLRPLILDRRV